MKVQIRTLLTDLKAACIIGHPGSIEVALEGFLVIPEISSNRRIEDPLLQQLIFPAGELVARSRMPAAQLFEYLNASLTAYRAIAGWALGYRFGVDKAVSTTFLVPAGKDQRTEVRKALADGLCQKADRRKEALLRLGSSWLEDSSARLNAAALYFLPCIIPQLTPQITALLQTMRISPSGMSERQHALAEALSKWGRGEGASQVFDLLLSWASDPGVDVWLITHVVDTLCQEGESQVVMDILTALEVNFPEDRAVLKLRRKLTGEQN